MFIEKNVSFVQYSPEGSPWDLLESARVIIKNLKDEQKTLPVTLSNDNKKCLDFDLDKTVFRSAPKSAVKMAVINPCNKTLLEVMDMV